MLMPVFTWTSKKNSSPSGVSVILVSIHAPRAGANLPSRAYHKDSSSLAAVGARRFGTTTQRNLTPRGIGLGPVIL
jgi:hypothetical protein